MKHKQRRKKPSLPVAEARDDDGVKMEVDLGLAKSIENLTLQNDAFTCQDYGPGLCIGVEIPSNLEDGDYDCRSSNSIFDGISSSESYPASTSGSSSGVHERNIGSITRHRNKQKRVVAVAGTVSNLLGKDYVKRVDVSKGKEIAKGLEREEQEKFLFSMFGSNGDLTMEMIRDVVCQCRFDTETTVDCLLELSGSQDISFQPDDWDDKFAVHGNTRGYFQALLGNPYDNPLQNEVTLPLDLLESLFAFPKRSGTCSNSINWKNVANRMKSLRGCNQYILTVCDALHDQEHSDEEYHKFRETAKQHWEMMKSNYSRASVEYLKGKKEYASYLADKGREQTRLALRADRKASKDIFQARNKDIENWVTIDLHGQHVKDAMKLLKLHLLFGIYAESVKKLRVITGCGSHGIGKSKLKQSISQFLNKEGIKWSEENRGTLLVQLEGVKEVSFVDFDSDSD